MLSLKRILVAVDFTETSDKAFDFALELAEKFGASVIAMHAFEIPIIGFPDGRTARSWRRPTSRRASRRPRRRGWTPPCPLARGAAA
jgi:nucleotide-binding universal stress UspA family protein